MILDDIGWETKLAMGQGEVVAKHDQNQNGQWV